MRLTLLLLIFAFWVTAPAATEEMKEITAVRNEIVSVRKLKKAGRADHVVEIVTNRLEKFLADGPYEMQLYRTYEKVIDRLRRVYVDGSVEGKVTTLLIGRAILAKLVQPEAMELTKANVRMQVDTRKSLILSQIRGLLSGLNHHRKQLDPYFVAETEQVIQLEAARWLRTMVDRSRPPVAEDGRAVAMTGLEELTCVYYGQHLVLCPANNCKK